MTISTETQERARKIIRAGLDAQFKGRVRFADIRSSPMLDQDDEEFLNVSVIYEGDRKGLEPHLCNSLYQGIRDQLVDIGIRTVPSISYVDRADDSKLAVKAPGPG